MSSRLLFSNIINLSDKFKAASFKSANSVVFAATLEKSNNILKSFSNKSLVSNPFTTGLLASASPKFITPFLPASKVTE